MRLGPGAANSLPRASGVRPDCVQRGGPSVVEKTFVGLSLPLRRAMGPKREGNRAPKELTREKLLATQLSVKRPESGWRDLDDERIDALKANFRDGQWGMNIMAGISVLSGTDCDGNRLVDDGLSTVVALQALTQEFPGALVRTFANHLAILIWILSCACNPGYLI